MISKSLTSLLQICKNVLPRACTHAPSWKATLDGQVLRVKVDVQFLEPRKLSQHWLGDVFHWRHHAKRIILTHVSAESVHKSLNRTVAIGHQNWWKHIPKYQPKIEMMEGTGSGSFSFVLKLLTSASRLFSSTGYPTKAQLPHLRRRCLIHLRCANFVLILTTWCETGSTKNQLLLGKPGFFGHPCHPSIKS